MDDARWIVHEAADARFMPVGFGIAPLARRKHEIHLFRRVIVVGVACPRRDKAGADPDVIALLKTAVADKYCVGVVLGKALGVVGALDTPAPLQACAEV